MALCEQGTLMRRSTDGPPLYFYSAAPDGPSLAVVGVLHGYGEYGARYARVMHAWSERGIASIAVDMRGHGRAGGRRGHCDRFDEYLDDAVELSRLTIDKGKPAFLFGHSFGGLVAASSVLDRPTPWRGLVLSAPMAAVALDVSLAKRLVGRLASRLLPGLALPNGVRSSDVTHDVELARAYDADPLVHHIATARWFSEAQSAQTRLLKRAPSLSMPLYVAMGTADRVVKLEAARSFFDAVCSSDKTWVSCEGLFHEILNEPEWRGIADGMADFVVAHA